MKTASLGLLEVMVVRVNAGGGNAPTFYSFGGTERYATSRTHVENKNWNP